ncbi:MAG TPA: helix-turn-helix domain-containing protein [Sphingomonas sp.]|nr:helix-turn-helix domain-containing protein [Sphingomonas sp.]
MDDRYIPPERHQLLFEIAAREFAAHGFENASLNAIIRACGLSKSSFYHFFASKEALFDRVVEAAAAALARDLAAPNPETFAGPQFWDRVAAFTGEALLIASRQAWYADFGRLFYLPDHAASRSKVLAHILAEVADWVARVIAVGRASGAVGDDLPASLQAELVFAVLQAMDRWSLHHLEDLDETTQANLLASQFDALRRLLAPRL